MELEERIKLIKETTATLNTLLGEVDWKAKDIEIYFTGRFLCGYYTSGFIEEPIKVRISQTKQL